jgi:hypothetical protein
MSIPTSATITITASSWATCNPAVGSSGISNNNNNSTSHGNNNVSIFQTFRCHSDRRDHVWICFSCQFSWYSIWDLKICHSCHNSSSTNATAYPIAVDDQMATTIQLQGVHAIGTLKPANQDDEEGTATQKTAAAASASAA